MIMAFSFRYLAIAYPMRSVWLSSIGRAKKVIALIWLTSAVLAIPTALRMVSNKGGATDRQVIDT